MRFDTEVGGQDCVLKKKWQRSRTYSTSDGDVQFLEEERNRGEMMIAAAL